MMVLLSAGVHTTLLHALTELSRPHLLGEGPILLLRSKLLETLLRSVKMLYVDLVKVVGPRAWGCSVIGACVALDEPRDVRLPWEVEAAAKGKGRETAAMEGLEGTGPFSKNVSSLAVLAETAIRDLYDLREVHEDADAPGPSTPTSSHTKRAPSAALGFLLRLLEDCSQSSGSSWRAGSLLASESSRFRLADMICQLIAGTVRLGYQRAAVLGEPEVIAEALHRVIEHGHGKVHLSLYAVVAQADNAGHDAGARGSAVCSLGTHKRPPAICSCRHSDRFGASIVAFRPQPTLIKIPRSGRETRRPHYGTHPVPERILASCSCNLVHPAVFTLTLYC